MANNTTHIIPTAQRELDDAWEAYCRGKSRDEILRTLETFFAQTIAKREKVVETR